MQVSKQEQHANELKIFQFRSEAGLQEMRLWLLSRLEEINRSWTNSVTVDELRSLQGQARLLKTQLKILEQGPTIKEAAK